MTDTDKIGWYLDHAPEPTIVVNHDGAISGCSASALSLFETGGLVGRSVHDFVPSHVANHEDLLEGFFTESSVRRMGADGSNVELITATGQILPVTISLAPVTLHGEPAVIASINAEVGDLLSRLNRTNDALRIAAHAVRHEVGEPIRGLISVSRRIALAVANNEELVKLCGDVKQLGMEAERSMHAILGYVDAADPEPEIVDLYILANEAIDLVELTHRDTPAQFNVTGAGHAWFDPSHAKTILLKLIENAVKYAEPEPQVTVRVADGLVAVSDNGVGIAAEDIPKLFKLGARFHTDVVGSGVGLAWAQVMAESGGGAIGVESILDEGSTFTVTFPVPT